MKNWITFAILVVFIFSCDNDLNKIQEGSFYILGSGENFSDSTEVFLKVQESNKIIPLDTTYIVNNTFQFKGQINKPSIYGVYIDSLKGSIGIFMQNDSITINVNKNQLENSKVIGSDLNNQYSAFIKKSNQIISKTNYLFPLFQKARTENDVDKLVTINQKIEAIYKENSTFVLNYAKQNTDSYIAAVALHTLLKDNSVSKDTIALIYNSFSHEVKKGDFAIEILLFLESNNKSD